MPTPPPARSRPSAAVHQVLFDHDVLAISSTSNLAAFEYSSG